MDKQALLELALTENELTIVADTKPSIYTDGKRFYQLRSVAINKGKDFCGWVKIETINPTSTDLIADLCEIYTDEPNMIKRFIDSEAIAKQSTTRKAIETQLSGGKMTDADYGRIFDAMDNVAEYQGNKKGLDEYIQSCYNEEVAENGTVLTIKIY